MTSGIEPKENQPTFTRAAVPVAAVPLNSTARPRGNSKKSNPRCAESGIKFFGGRISLDDYSVRMESFNEDARCAIKLWAVVRGCFGDEEAVDARPDDKWLLQQVFPGQLKEHEIKELKELRDNLGRSQGRKSSHREKGD
jgi:hypothetical protein